MARNEWSLDGHVLYDKVEAWIRENLSDAAANHANYGWFVDEVEGTISTKIYGAFAGCVTIDTRGNIEHEEF